MGYFHTKVSDCERNDHEESPMHLGYTVIPLVSTILLNIRVYAGILCKKSTLEKEMDTEIN